MSGRSAAELALCVCLLVFSCAYAGRFVLQNVFVSLSLGLLVLCLMASELNINMCGGAFRKGLRVLHALALLCLGVCFFVVANNVFLMQVGFKHCRGCAPSTAFLIAVAYAYALAYAGAMLFFVRSFFRRKVPSSGRLDADSVPLGHIKAAI